MQKPGEVEPDFDEPVPFVPWKKGQRYRTTSDGYLIKMEYESDESDGHSSSQSARRACEDSDSEEELVCELAKFSSQSSA